MVVERRTSTSFGAQPVAQSMPCAGSRVRLSVQRQGQALGCQNGTASITVMPGFDPRLLMGLRGVRARSM